MATQSLPLLAPMLSASSKPFSSKDYLFEPKWDGFRCLAYLENQKTVLFSRRGMDLSQSFPELNGLHKLLSGCPAILDGEIVIFHEGKDQFHLLLQRIRQRSMELVHIPAVFIAFDLLYLHGTPLMNTCLQERKEKLSQNVPAADNLLVNSYILASGEIFFDAAIAQGREGIMAKRLDSLYLPGRRSRNWLKIKAINTTEAVVAGYIPKGRHSFASLILGQYRASDGRLVHVGNVGTGFSSRDVREIVDELRKLSAKDGPPLFLNLETHAVVWAMPLLVVEVRYMEYTASGQLRHPVYIGPRLDVAPEECILPQKFS
ncbi:MAG: ATP-dependent DNA ligase [Firmicutes bacterium]|nr:ATP-dependent DNA ligase [Bacillota bacterium]